MDEQPGAVGAANDLVWPSSEFGTGEDGAACGRDRHLGRAFTAAPSSVQDQNAFLGPRGEGHSEDAQQGDARERLHSKRHTASRGKEDRQPRVIGQK
jgi:hypothetical protein